MKGKGEKMASKGANYERDICKRLSLWWTSGKRDDIFWRTAGSGARATARMKNGLKTKNSAGDVGFIHPIGEDFVNFFHVTLKKGYTSLGRLRADKIEKVVKKLRSKDASVKEWTKGIQNLLSGLKRGGEIIDALDCIDSDKKRKLLLHEWFESELKRIQHDQYRTMFIFRRDGKQDCVVLDHNLYIKISTYVGRFLNKRYLTICHDNYYLLVYRLEDFFKWCTPSAIKYLLKEHQKIDQKLWNEDRRRTAETYLNDAEEEEVEITEDDIKSNNSVKTDYQKKMGKKVETDLNRRIEALKVKRLAAKKRAKDQNKKTSKRRKLKKINFAQAKL
jgi:hypothetical protein